MRPPSTLLLSRTMLFCTTLLMFFNIVAADARGGWLPRKPRPQPPKPQPAEVEPSTPSTMEITSGSTGMPTTAEEITTTTSTAGPLPTSKQTTVETTATTKQTTIETTATISEFPEETTKTTSTAGPLPTSSQAADSGSSNVLIISIVAGLIAFIILIAILIYCLFRRKKEVANDKEEEEVEDEEDSSEVENSEVFENFVKKHQPSLMITEKNKPTGEITTDWTDYETIEPKKIKVV